ncbi:MAG TPA: hypothetical protein ENI34_09890 [candidate division WOR-3 bacterium]|uniref:DNA polymerase III delta N-terminal domain-containing protein n=1 Tax=candidate division WOR-3 bacterium TaxID=2052148 RepID=A0A9C9ENW3_UNCW3|nr:hypothetical protein [candidate division WOR-3 bacterium]
MTDRELREELKKGIIGNRYLLVGDETLLINNTISLIKKHLQVNEAFDFETFSISEIPLEEMIEKFYVTPFGSKQRLIVIKNLEELDKRALKNFAEAINKLSFPNCLIMTYRAKKDNRRTKNVYKNITGLFKKIHCVTFQSDKNLIHKWITSRLKRDGLTFSPSVIRYLEEEFGNDITGLKNEIEKIENYLYEAKTLHSASTLKDLARGLCDFNKYQVVDMFLKGRKDTIEHFEEFKPYLRSYSEMVDAVTRGLLYYVQRKPNVLTARKKALSNLLAEVSRIDRSVKKSSYFVTLMFELFFLKKGNIFRKGGAINGR